MSTAVQTDKKELLVRFLEEVWSEGDVEASDDYLASSYTVHHDPGDPWDSQTLDLRGFKQRVRLSRAPFPDQRFDVQDVFSDGDRVAVTWLWTGTHTGDLPGFPASGTQIKTSGLTIYYFHDDRISGHWQVTDRLGVYQQLRPRASPAP